jgi:hypothetical protein
LIRREVVSYNFLEEESGCAWQKEKEYIRVNSSVTCSFFIIDDYQVKKTKLTNKK